MTTIEYRDVRERSGIRVLFAQQPEPVDINTGVSLSNSDLQRVYTQLSGTGYRVRLARSVSVTGVMPMRGTVTEIDADFVYVEGEDGESYNIQRGLFHTSYIVDLE